MQQAVALSTIRIPLLSLPSKRRQGHLKTISFMLENFLKSIVLTSGGDSSSGVI
jgi:hypothetical protein